MVRTRFAPSPTGYLHIGGVRTALFCWLFARRHGGKFLLRIDDTDRQRNVDEALAPILAGFRWLGIDWDEGPEVGGPHAPYFQSQRQARYQAAVKELLDKGAAYRDFATPEEIQTEREAAQSEKRTFRYSRQWMAKNSEDAARFEAEGRQGVVRLVMPAEGRLCLDDVVRGRVEWDWANEQDHVIQRADGSFLYHLASVVDDHDFGITHVIRAEEHLSNTPRQVFIAEGLGYELPQYAHLPYVAEPGSKNKLSKRKLAKYLKNRDFAKLNEHGKKIAAAIGLETSADTFNPVIVDFYREIGFLPQAILNYLLLLGWSLDDKTETFSPQEMIDQFSLERVNKAPASFDPTKLMVFQDRYMQRLSAEDKTAFVLPYLQKANLVAGPASAEVTSKVEQIVVAAADRITIGGDILDFGDFFAPDDELPYEEKPFEKRIRGAPESVELLRKFKDQLATSETFDAAHLDQLLHDFVEREGIKIGQIIHALRVAVTGKAVGFGIFDALAIIGQASSVARIDRALSRL